MTKRSSPKPSRKEQVAAVCYRFAEDGLEFLLVQTRAGSRWTFPKGSLEPGMTRAQTAALEAFEEAGVRGRMEEAPFSHYIRRAAKALEDQVFVQAYLCEVLWLGRPQEGKRNPTWFSAEKAKKRLAENRSDEETSGYARVVECAVARIERLRIAQAAPPDELQRVQFEAPEAAVHARIEHAAFARYVRGREPGAMEFAIGTRISRILGPARRQPLLRMKALGTGKGNS